MKKILCYGAMGKRILTVLLLFATGLYGQREASNWYFGKNAGLDFNSGAPVPLLDGQINTVEGCESFSDANGNLLFYTEGKTVWNKNHQVMPNGTGLRGSFSTSQSALVVPNPVDKNIYYIFTPDDALAQQLSGSSNGFNYSVVDMGRNSGLGDVTTKNVELLPQCSEKVSAVRNAAGDFYWVVTHFTNRFYAYRVDENGVDTTPVVSQVGPWIEDFENIRGSLKLSPDGTKLAITHTIVEPEFEAGFYLFDFDVDTGLVSNPVSVSDTRLYYGVEFSSNSTKLYASGLRLEQRGDTLALGGLQITQYDLQAPNLTASEYLVHDFGSPLRTFVAGALQIGIDKKIYHAIPNERLSVIRPPNLDGLDSDFRPYGVNLGDRAATYGLPPFVQSFFETIVTIENFCEGDKTTFTTESTGNIVAIQWDFGDPASGTANFSTELNPTHIYSTNGTFTVTIDVEYANGSSRQFLEFVEIAETPNVNSQVELVQCDVDGVNDGITTFNLRQAIPLFNNGNEDITGLFFLQEADAIANQNVLDPIGFVNTVSGQTIYARAFENSECFSIVEIQLTAEPMTDLGEYDTLFICEGRVAVIATIVNITEVHEQLTADFSAYDSLQIFLRRDEAVLEQNPMPLEEHTFGPLDALEVYFRVEDNDACAFIGKVKLNVSQPPEFEPLVQVSLCRGRAELTALDGFDSYLWPDGSQAASYLATQTGTVDVVFSNGPCMYTQSFEVLEEPEIVLDEVIVNDFQRNISLEVLADSASELDSLRFSLDGGSNYQDSNIFRGVFPGLYRLTIDNGCSVLEQEVLVGGTPAFFTPNNDGFNDSWTMMNQEFFPDYTISIFDRYGKLLRSFGEGQSWDGTFNNRLMPADDYWYHLTLADGRTVKGYFALKR